MLEEEDEEEDDDDGDFEEEVFDCAGDDKITEKVREAASSVVGVPRRTSLVKSK